MVIFSASMMNELPSLPRSEKFSAASLTTTMQTLTCLQAELKDLVKLQVNPIAICMLMRSRHLFKMQLSHLVSK